MSSDSSSSPPSPARRRCVLLLALDGFRPDCITADHAPTLHAAISGKPPSDCFAATDRVSYSLESQVGDICWSGPGWTSACSGVWRDKHGVSGNTFGSHQKESYPSIFARVHAAVPEAVTACSINWRPLAENILHPATHSAVHEDDDAAVEASASTMLRSLPRLDALVVHLDDVDAAGHNYDYGPSVPEYVAAVKNTEARVARLLRVLRSEREWYHEEDWLVIVTTDHGGIDYTHEDGRPENRTNFLILAGHDALGGEILPAPLIVDVAPTLLSFLRVPLASAWHLDGRPVGLALRRERGAHWMDLSASQDPENKFPIPPEELEEGPAPEGSTAELVKQEQRAAAEALGV